MRLMVSAHGDATVVQPVATLALLDGVRLRRLPAFDDDADAALAAPRARAA